MLMERSLATYWAVRTALLLVILLPGCHKALAPDAICSYEPLPAGMSVPAGQGGIEVLASTDSYFTVHDNAGKQITSEHVNAIRAVPAGDYQVAINDSKHATSAKSNTLTKCVTGAVLVSGKTDEYYAVLDQAARQLASAHVGSALSLFPGSYKVRLNNTEVSANLQAGATVELKSGSMNVDVGTDEYYAVLDAGARQLASSHVGRALGLFPGSYAVRINNTEGRADVRASEITNVPAGVLLVHGPTDEYYAIADNAGKQLASAHLEKPLGLFPATYSVKLNNTSAVVTVTARVTSEVKAGTMVLQGATDEYYAVLDSAGTQLASAHLGRPLSFMPGTYRAKLNNTATQVQVEAGRVGEYHSGSLTVATTKSGYYVVLDTSGTQLVSKQVNQPVSLIPGKYSVKLGDNSRSATVTAGQSVVLNW